MNSVRLMSDDQGPVHVVQNDGVDLAYGWVIFLHGLRVGIKKNRDAWYVDQMFAKHRIEGQFMQSGSKATLVVPATRSKRGRTAPWPELEKLLAWVIDATRSTQMLDLPSIEVPIQVIGHSGAYSHIAKWLDEDIQHVTLIDGLYSDYKTYREYALDGGTRLDLAVCRNYAAPHQNSIKLVKSLSAGTGTKIQKGMPEDFDDIILNAKVFYMSEAIKHMDWVDGSRHGMLHFFFELGDLVKQRRLGLEATETETDRRDDIKMLRELARCAEDNEEVLFHASDANRLYLIADRLEKENSNECS